MEANVASKRFAAQIAMMIDSRLIWYEHYSGWADELIRTMPQPPLWVIDVATIRHYREAIEAINRFVRCPPFEEIDCETLGNQYVACLLLKHQSGATSWATFLNDAGLYSDPNGGRKCCEYFYQMLTELEHREYDDTVACQQRAIVEAEYAAELADIQSLYKAFVKHFRAFVANGE